MDCATVTRLLDRWLDNELDQEQSRALALHLEGCPACSALASEALDLKRYLDALPAPKPPAGLTRRIMATIRNEEDRFNLVDWWRSMGAAARGGALAMAVCGVLLGSLLGLQSGAATTTTTTAQTTYVDYFLADNGEWL